MKRKRFCVSIRTSTAEKLKEVVARLNADKAAANKLLGRPPRESWTVSGLVEWLVLTAVPELPEETPFDE